jgi:HK97 family phage portal protein
MSSFRRNLIIDLILDGNIFIYFDGAGLYHLPANFVTIEPDTRTYIKQYKFQADKTFSPDEIIHIKENSFYSIYRGTSRLRPARRTMGLLANMRQFQDNFFINGAVPGLVIKSPNTLSEKIKERMIQSWMTRYRPNAGGRRPVVLDGGMEIDTITDVNFREMAFEESITSAEKQILKVLGIPPILLDSGNNANIRPNHRLYYLETIIPIIRKINFAFERYIGYEISEDVTNIPALQPELSDQGAYYQSLVNGGILTPNEARDNLGYGPLEGADTIRVPANIAGSAAIPSTGGRPSEGEQV